MKVEMLNIEHLRKNERNPNTMDERTFNALCESIQEEGWLEPLQVVEVGVDDTEHPVFEIVGGHHRFDAARTMGWDEVPCVLLDPEKFDQDRRDWAMVKVNILRGKLDPIKFARLYEEMAEKYQAETLQALMGFTSEDAFKKVYREVKAALPKDLQDALDDVKDEIRTIDDLSLVLNRLFAEHGETLPSNFMVFSWGGKEVLWVRCDEELWKLAKATAESQEDATDAFKDALRSA